MNEAVSQMLQKYSPQSAHDYENALKEILQEIVLLALSRAGFFERAAFYGGTALRILHGLDRFSEDLDFTLLSPDKSFKLDKYFGAMQRELAAFNFQFTLTRVEKDLDRLTESAFLKTNTQMLLLQIESPDVIVKSVPSNQKIKIKFEIDVDSPPGFSTEIKTLLLPSPFTVRAITLPGLFAGKMHAALLRNWKNRVKGRDFYDVQWYIARNMPLSLNYLGQKLRASGALSEPLTRERLIELFTTRVESIDFKKAQSDVMPFVKDSNQVKLWSAEFFKEIIGRIQVTD